MAFQPKGPSSPPGSPPISYCNDVLPSGAACPGERGACGRRAGGPREGRAGGSLAMAPTPSPKCHLPPAPEVESRISLHSALVPRGVARPAGWPLQGLAQRRTVASAAPDLPQRGSGGRAAIAKCGGAWSARSKRLCRARTVDCVRAAAERARTQPASTAACRGGGGLALERAAQAVLAARPRRRRSGFVSQRRTPVPVGEHAASAPISRRSDSAFAGSS